MKYKTDQEDFWAGDFGSEYIDRNQGQKLLASNIVFFSRALARAESISNCIEFGANIGMNIRALQFLYPDMESYAVEINQKAASTLRQLIPDGNIHHTSILEFSPLRTWELVLTKGVLIHINPDWLANVYDLLYRSSSRYILLCEYYNPSPASIAYRGHEGKLFKRDFCGEMLERYTDLKLMDYGFTYRRDPNYPQDDITWFLLEKKN